MLFRSYVTDAIEDGFTIIILSDRSFDSGHAQIPSLLAVSAVHHDLIRKGLRGKVGLLVEAGDVWEPPAEPTERYGFKWYENPEARRAHRKAKNHTA